MDNIIELSRIYMNNVLLVKFRYHSTVNEEMFAQYIFSHNAKDARKYDNCMTFEIIIEKKKKESNFSSRL